MKLNEILFEPNTEYKATGELQADSSAKFTMSGITLKTGNNGEIIEFSDHLLMDKSGKTIKEDAGMAEMYEYLQLENMETGRIFNLKLHTAAVKGDLYLATEALSEKHDIDLRMKQGATPLHWASAHGHFEIVKLLVEHNADINCTDDLGWTPILLAASQKHIEVAVFLKENGAKLTGVLNGKEVHLNFK